MSQVWLCWDDGQAVGFCCVKVKGHTVPGDPGTTFGMNIVSAVFIRFPSATPALPTPDPRRSHRRRGLGKELLSNLFSSYPGALGFSSPISVGMRALLVGLLDEKEAGRREEVWECGEAGGKGDRRNVWWSRGRRPVL